MELKAWAHLGNWKNKCSEDDIRKWKEAGIGKMNLYSFKFIKNNDSNFFLYGKVSLFKKPKGIRPYRGKTLCKIIMFRK